MLEKVGGIKGLETKLKTDYKKGLSGDAKDLAQRIELYGKNEVNSTMFHLAGNCAHVHLPVLLSCTVS